MEEAPAATEDEEPVNEIIPVTWAASRLGCLYHAPVVWGLEMNATCRVQPQEPNVQLGYGVGWNPPPGLVESVGIHIGWAGRRLGVGEQSPSLCDAPPTQPGYPERLREVAPGRAQVSGPVDRVSAFHYRLKVTHGQGLGKDNRSC